jgi:uncharacterized protein (DUF2147 family)
MRWRRRRTDPRVGTNTACPRDTARLAGSSRRERVNGIGGGSTRSGFRLGQREVHPTCTPGTRRHEWTLHDEARSRPSASRCTKVAASRATSGMSAAHASADAVSVKSAPRTAPGGACFGTDRAVGGTTTAGRQRPQRCGTAAGEGNASKGTNRVAGNGRHDSSWHTLLEPAGARAFGSTKQAGRERGRETQRTLSVPGCNMPGAQSGVNRRGGESPRGRNVMCSGGAGTPKAGGNIGRE